MIYAGEEYGAEHTPSLFDKDTVDLSRNDMSDVLIPLLAKLAQIKREAVFTDSVYTVRAQEERFLIAKHESKRGKALGVFAVKGDTGYVEVDFPDGVYTELISSEAVEVFRGGVQCFGAPMILIAE